MKVTYCFISFGIAGKRHTKRVLENVGEVKTKKKKKRDKKIIKRIAGSVMTNIK
jgi:hypothetical protein